MNDPNQDGGGAGGPGLMVAIGAPKDSGSSSSEDCIPLSALGMPDETEQMQSPEVGDKVQYTVEGTVSRIDGDEAYVKRDTVNGQPINDGANEVDAGDQNPAEMPQDDEKSLRDMAQNTQLQ